MKWELKSFDEIGFIGRGKSRHRPRNAEHLYGGEYPFIQTGDIKAANFRIFEYSQTYNETGLAQSKLWKEGTLCITIAANIADTAILGIDACFPDSVIGFVADENKSDVRFVKYFFDIFQARMKSISTGAAQDNLSLEKLLTFKIPIPPLPTQRRIASILSAYDDLIENNLKRIKLLEEKARFEYRLIQKNERLQFKKVREVLQFTTGKLNSNAAIEKGTYPFFTCGQEILRTNTYSFDEEVVLLGGNNASAIYPIFYYKGKFDAYQRTYIIKPRPEILVSFKYLYFFWEGKLDYLKNISTGAATKFLTLKILNDIDISLPNKSVMERFENLTEPIFKLKAILTDQNALLRQARDILLPRLMSGEIEI